MALFGPGPSLIDKLSNAFGQGGASAGSDTASLAELFPEAAARNPLLSYLSNNQDAAKQVATQLLGGKPEPDYRMALAQMGLGILQAPTDQPLLSAVAQGAQTALPAFMDERNRGREFDSKVSSLATQLSMKEFDLLQRMNSEDAIVEIGGNVVNNRDLQQALRSGAPVKEAWESSILVPDKGSTEKNAEAYSLARQRLLQMQGDPSADPAEIQQAADKVQALKWQLKDEPTPGTFSFMTPDGTYVSGVGGAGEVGEALIQIGDAKAADDLRERQAAVDSTLEYASNALRILNDASSLAPGRLGGMASSAAAWGKAIKRGLTGQRGRQFEQEVAADPNGYLQKLASDPEARAWLDDGTLEYLSEIGQDRTELLSNIIGLGYATARTEERGGRLATSDVAFALSRVGYDLDALLNDPAAVERGLLALTQNNLNGYERQVTLYAGTAEKAKEMLSRDVVLNSRLPEYGFRWEGEGVQKRLTFGDPSQPSGAGDVTPPAAPQQQQQPAGQPGMTEATPFQGPQGEPLTPAQAATAVPDGAWFRVSPTKSIQMTPEVRERARRNAQ